LLRVQGIHFDYGPQAGKQRWQSAAMAVRRLCKGGEMSEKRRFVLAHLEARRNCAQYAVAAPDGWQVVFQPITRNLEQNAKLHALFSDIAKTEKYLGRVMSAVQWKTLFISGHAIATGLGVDMVLGIEGEYCNVRESSASMTVARMSSLIEYVGAWQAVQEATC
jgi:hypothetical protein